MPYDSKTVANTVLNKAKMEGAPITPLKLQKLMYFLHGWYLALKDEVLIPENFEAWEYGPVLPSIYHSLKHYGRNPVDEFIFFMLPYNSAPAAYLVHEEDNDFYEILDKIWKVYAQYSGLQLSAMTHKQGSPWDKTKRNYEAFLKNSDIRDFFKKQMNE